VHLGCEEAIPRRASDPPRRGSITLGPVELVGVARLGDVQVALRGGVKVPLLVQPNEAVTIRIVAPKDALAFIPQPEGTFPPGRPSMPLPDGSARTLTTDACAPRVGADPRLPLPSFVAIARPACARIEVRDARGRVASRTVSFGAGRCGA
jgi:hypothetical protein